MQKAQARPQEPVIVVMLRQPRLNQKTEMRSDPFWEFGSFGLTGCHQRNLMHPKRISELIGARLAFIQGGNHGHRLVYLTEPVQAVPLSDRSEVTWEPASMPFRYENAPLVLDQEGRSRIPAFRDLIKDCNRNGWLGKFASKFRSRREPLPNRVARQLVAVYETEREQAQPQDIASTYEQALPVPPPCIDRRRRQTFLGLKRAI